MANRVSPGDKMSTLRKIGRELGRVISPHHWGQKAALRLRQLYAHTLLPENKIRFDLDELGQVSGQTLVCFVSYAPSGLRPDTKAALQLMQAKPETKVFLVSNCPLVVEDQAWLEGQGLAYVATSNDGYDFGAYRKFVLSMLETDQAPERLVLTNDSFVFPLEAQALAPILHDQTLGADFVGLIDQGKRGGRQRHFCSFYLSFSKAVVTSPPFQRFWRSLRPMPSRTYTIQLGEKGLSQALLKAGFSAETHFHKAGLIAALKALETDQDRADLIEALGISDLFTLAQWQAFQAAPWAQQLQKVVRLVHGTENLKLSALFTRFCGMPFIKTRNLREQGQLHAWYAARYPVIADLKV